MKRHLANPFPVIRSYPGSNPCLIRTGLPFWLIFLSIVVGLGWGRVHAQLQTSALPGADYYNAFYEFYGADYKNAVKDFSRGSQTAYRFGNNRYLDSVCYYTMIGECHYHMGNFGPAIEHYEHALNLYLTHNAADWQSRVEVPEITARQQVAQRAGITWGTTSRGGTVANIPRSMTTLFGRLDAGRVYSEGGVLDSPEQRSVNVKEIMRCTALCLHRRRLIMGVTCKFDSFTSKLVAGLASSRGNGDLFRAWNSVLLGIAQASMDDFTLAKRTLANGLQFNGGMDHNLTPIALQELALVSFALGEHDDAEKLAMEASFSAAVHNQYDLVEESLSLGTTIHLMTQRSAYPPLQAAIEWAVRENARLLNVSLIERLAECYVEAGDADAASNVLNEARRPMSRTSLSRAVVNSRLEFVSAQIALMNGDRERGMAELREALLDFQTGSRWLFQLGLTDSQVMSGNLSGLRADQLYSTLLRDPTKEEWLIDPMECLAFLMTPHVAPMERWFETKLMNKQYDKAIEIADLVRRHRFFAALPLAGRLLALRWLMEGPDESLTKVMTDQRQNLLERFPDYKQLSDRARAIRNELIALPLKPDPDSAELKKQTSLFVELSKISKSQEAILLSFAVLRQPADMAFPPQTDLSAFHDELQPHQAALVTLATGNGIHCFLVTSEQQKYLGTIATRTVGSSVSRFLKSIGLQDNSGGIDTDILADESWKVAANVVAKNIFVDNSDIEWAKFKELVVVPDGILWYVPFELLQIENSPVAAVKPGALDPGGLDPGAVDPDADPDKKPKKKKRRKKKASIDPAKLSSLGEILNIRYSPTLFMAFGTHRPDRRLARTAVVVGRMHPKGEIEHTQEVIKELQKDIPDIVIFEDKMAIPSSYYGAIIDRLVVCSDLRPPSKAGAFALDPVQLDKELNGSNLASWLSLPIWSPEHVILPGFTSGGAAGGRGKGDGQDIFLTACGVLASGSRSLMLSRWRVGGRNSLELTRRYARNLSEMTPVVALKESIKESRKLDLDLNAEPRIKQKKSAAPIKAEHPFFWAGHMVIEIPDSRTPIDPDKNVAQLNPDAAAAAAANPAGAMPGDGTDPNALPENPDLPDKPADADGSLIKDVDAKKASEEKIDKSNQRD